MDGKHNFLSKYYTTRLAMKTKNGLPRKCELEPTC